jgi:PLP dependent protein
MSLISDNLCRVRERIQAASAKAGRDADQVMLVGVSKNCPAEAIREAFIAGVRHFGENRVQEWEGKRAQLAGISGEFTSHLIGHLQSNKAARAAKSFDFIDSVDDLSLGQKLNRSLAENPSGAKLPVLLEVHIGGEDTKTGIAKVALPQLAERILELNFLQLQGLMCIPPYAANPEDARPYFFQLRRLKETLETSLKISLPRLSMGMSHDLEIAIEEGATEIRVGTAIFGTRVAV